MNSRKTYKLKVDSMKGPGMRTKETNRNTCRALEPF